MQIGNLPFVTADASLQDAVDELRQSGQSGLVVLKDDDAVLFQASELHEHLSERAADLMKDFAGGTVLPPEGAAAAAAVGSAIEAMFLRTEGGRAVVKFLSQPLYVRVASRMYYCTLNSAHYYNSSEVATLKKIPGGWECDQGDLGLVK
jgi:hypothetical protein